ncbi:MarR family transcriptional regulator [Micrococcales bacterium 31B]|nr:MarR family transcriptional regulator [Micrococcales bacterium 31B]
MASVEWLDEDQQKIWRNYIRVTGMVGEHLGLALEHPACDGMNLPEYELLVRLSEAPEQTLRMSDLANDLVYSRSRTTHAVRRMEQRGWVERRPCPDDGRGIQCTLTSGGLAALQAAAPVHVRSVRESVVDLLEPDQYRALGAILETMVERLELLQAERSEARKAAD